MYGFLNKKRSGKIMNTDSQRWFLLLSSFPLNFKDYMDDQKRLSETMIPALLDFDVIYYYDISNDNT